MQAALISADYLLAIECIRIMVSRVPMTRAMHPAKLLQGGDSNIPAQAECQGPASVQAMYLAMACRAGEGLVTGQISFQ